jgi:hypothetical protein
MGYELKPRTTTFVFDQEPYAGLEVEMRTNPPMVDVWKIAATDLSSLDTISKSREFLTYFASLLFVGWNLEEKGKPVPATPENFADKLDLAVAKGLVEGVAQQIGALEGPLALPSRNGSTSKVHPALASPRPSRKRSSSSR